MSDPQTLLVEQAGACVELVEDGQLSEALVVLQSLSNALVQSPVVTQDPASTHQSQQIADLLAQALVGATTQREATRTKLQSLRNEQQVKSLYTASGSPH